jgi:hypothetical protein
LVVVELLEQIQGTVVAHLVAQLLVVLGLHLQVVVEVVVLTLKQVHQADQVVVEPVLDLALGTE